MFVFDGKYSDVHPNAQFFFWIKRCNKSAVKHFMEKPFKLNFVNLFQNPVQDCLRKQNFISS